MEMGPFINPAQILNAHRYMYQFFPNTEMQLSGPSETKRRTATQLTN